MTSTSYFGKYRGTVVNNVDVMGIGRIQVMVPDVTNVMLSSWAMPCYPIAGPQCGVYAVPMVGSGVWIEFEQGDVDYPIWTGCFYGTKAEVPSVTMRAPPIPPGAPVFAVQTITQGGLTVSDVPGPLGGVHLSSLTGARIVVNDTGIYIDNGKGASINMVGPIITINNGALVIT
jgi:hypothetical protein